jgi:hypothetical protein
MKLTTVKGTSHELTLRNIEPGDEQLEAFDYTKFSAINTCPTYGITRFQMHLRMPMQGRAMALEAGTAMHEVFAFVRLASLLSQLEERGKDKTYIDAVYNHHGVRLFGLERLTHITEQISTATDLPEVCKRGAIAVLDTSGFYDDPRDKRRTLSNLEECAYAYINRWRFDHPVWTRNDNDPTCDVGIEIPFELHASITGDDYFQFRLVGRIDGLHYDGNKRLTVQDNKTASRLSDAWTMSQVTSHQFSIYCMAGTHFTQTVVDRCVVLGLAIPQPRTYEYSGVASESMNRYDYHLVRCVDWMVHTLRVAKMYQNDPIRAPKFTHSCSRYFRPCMFIPLCYGDDTEQNQILGELEFDQWSPLDKVVLDGIGSE